jgi:hypothetical protein
VVDIEGRELHKLNELVGRTSKLTEAEEICSQQTDQMGFHFEYAVILSRPFFSCAPHAASKLADLFCSSNPAIYTTESVPNMNCIWRILRKTDELSK